MQPIRFDTGRLLGFRLASQPDARMGAKGGGKVGGKRPNGIAMGAKLGRKGGGGPTGPKA